MESPYGARVPNTGLPHREVPFYLHRLFLLTWGHKGIATRARMQKTAFASCFICFLFFFLWQHIAPFLGTVHCPHGACEWLMWLSRWSQSDKTERSGNTEGWESLWQKERCADKSKEGTIIYWTLTFCLLSDAAGMQVVHLKCLHGWLIKGEKLLLLINWQAQLHMSASSHPCMNRVHNGSP